MLHASEGHPEYLTLLRTLVVPPYADILSTLPPSPRRIRLDPLRSDAMPASGVFCRSSRQPSPCPTVVAVQQPGKGQEQGHSSDPIGSRAAKRATGKRCGEMFGKGHWPTPEYDPRLDDSCTGLLQYPATVFCTNRDLRDGYMMIPYDIIQQSRRESVCLDLTSMLQGEAVKAFEVTKVSL